MKIKLLPKTSLGKWSIKFIIVFFIFFIFSQILSLIGHKKGAFDSQSLGFFRLVVPFTIVFAGICGLTAFFTGIVSAIKNKEFSIFLLLSIFIGFFVLVFILGEFFSPH